MKLQKIAIILLIIIFAFFPFSFSNIFVQSQTSNEEAIDGYREWTRDKSINSLITVNAGATLVIKNGITLTFNGGSIDVQGKMVVSGTVKDPVKLQKSEDTALGYSINITDEGSLIMRNADVSGAGYEVYYVKNDSILNTASAFFAGGINLSGGSLDIQGSSFHNNNAAISIQGGQARVNRTKFFDNQYDVPQGSGDFRYNWWGSANGPSEICFEYNDEQICYHDKIDDQIDHSPYLNQEDFRDPVIIIPGIMGSWEKNGAMQIDPIFHTYDNLYGEFANNGYAPEQNLFTFPYEWRDSNTANAQKLKAKIDEIKSSQNWPKVDIVAHSMGGLLAREYIESGYYDNDVDQLITIATPNLGAPEAYVKWDGAEWFFSLIDIYMKHIIKQEAEEKGFADIFDYIHNRPVDSLKELLPVYDYLYDAGKKHSLRSYPDNYPRNIFLETLNNNSDKLSLVEYDKIIGNLRNNESTISGFNVIDADMGKYWIHGYPLGFEIPGDRGSRYSNGDATVPYFSAKSEDIKSDYAIELNSDHREIVTKAQKDVLELLTAKRPATEVNRSLIKNILIAQVYSPIDIQVIAPSGEWTGKNIKNLPEEDQIPGAYYTGYDGVDSEFLTIPDPEDGEYTIITEGTGTGEYKIEAVKISESETTGETAESVKTIAGTAVPGISEENTIEIAGAGIVGADENSEPEPVTIDSIISEVNGYAINAKDKKFILNKLDEIRKLPEDNKKQNIKQINKKIDDLIKEINKNNKFQIDQPTKDLLIESLNFIKLKI